MGGLPVGLGGIIPPVSTPMTEGFAVDEESLRRLIAFLIEGGVSGLFMLGSTSEAVFLTDGQRGRVIEIAVEAVAGRVPVLAGVVDMTTARCLDHARQAHGLGADALVLTAPFYMTPSQGEIIDHFHIVRAAVDLPIVAYDIPATVHTKLDRETVLALAREGVIVGLKDSSGIEGNFRRLALDRAALPGFHLFTGSELLVDIAVYVGASGAVPGLANVDPHGFVRLYDAATAGDWAKARKEQVRLVQLYDIVHVATPGRMGPGSGAFGAFKTALMMRGVIATNVVGRPQRRLNDDEATRVREILTHVDLL